MFLWTETVPFFTRKYHTYAFLCVTLPLCFSVSHFQCCGRLAEALAKSSEVSSGDCAEHLRRISDLEEELRRKKNASDLQQDMTNCLEEMRQRVVQVWRRTNERELQKTCLD